MFGESFKTPSATTGPETPPWADPEMQDEVSADSSLSEADSKPSITDLLKNPTKVVMCRVSLPPVHPDRAAHQMKKTVTVDILKMGH